ncbi:hypothetical protein BDW42DRAFT_164151 [Aspergillus taichungensis]|uniref:Uncharacterized protein n=1 Tax=Aspergillus taichungensis TaxID=482145 RepID=A0A2J5I1W7_9EURO|nr:hypothetical protein BDW42DRAFT_164151 [Aspergillus taichungensis]
MLLAYFWGPPRLPANQAQPPNSISATFVSLCRTLTILRTYSWVGCRRAKPLLRCSGFLDTAGCVVVFGGLTGIFVDLLPLFLHSNSTSCQEKAFLVLLSILIY